MKPTVAMVSSVLVLVLPALGAPQQKADNVTAVTSSQVKYVQEKVAVSWLP